MSDDNYEPEEMHIRFQHNGEGRIKWGKRLRVRNARGEKIAEGDAKTSTLQFEEFREQSFTVDGITVTGAWIEKLLAELANEAERQAAARERDNAEVEAREKQRKAELEAEQQRLAEQQAALAEAAKQAEAEAEAARQEVARKHAGKAERGA